MGRVIFYTGVRHEREAHGFSKTCFGFFMGHQVTPGSLKVYIQRTVMPPLTKIEKKKKKL